MILNPTHDITFSGLPSEILDAYVRYKKGSRAIVAWLVQYSSANYKGVRTLPIKELAALAQKVSSKINQVPEVIHFYFKETIAARRCLSRFFRSNIDASEEEVDTVNHEHFTNSLCDIYSDLCERCRAADAQRLVRKAARKSGGGSLPRNNFEYLPVEDAGDAAEVLQESKLECQQCNETAQTVCQGQRNALQIEDDTMSVAIETIMLLGKARDVYATVAECWKQAGEDKASFVAAAAITNTAWTHLRDIESQLKDINTNTDLANLHQRCYLFGDGIAITTSATSESKEHRLLLELKESERALKHYSDNHEFQVSAAIGIQKPADYIQVSTTASQSQPPKFYAAILDNILHLMRQAKSTPALVFKCTPCFTEIGYLLSRLKDNSHTFQCTLAMHLLITSYTAYYEALPVPASISLCRISALKLAGQGASSIAAILSDKPAFPCQCPQTLAYHLSNLQHELDSYKKHKRWDLYFQSPWVAGNHIIEILDMLAYYGMRLFHYRHFVGAVLHSYNILQQLGGLEKIPIFEEICDTFKDILFPGGVRPTSNFRNSWVRFIGARLRFKKGYKSHNHRDTWCMSIPAHEARNAAGLSTDQARERNDPKFDYGRIDPLIRLKQQDWHSLNDAKPNEIISQLDTLEKKRSSTSSKPRSKSASSSAEALSQPISGSTIPVPTTATISPLKTALLNLDSCLTQNSDLSVSSSSTIPTSSLNLLTLFHTSQKITSSITSTLHAPRPSSTSASPSKSSSSPETASKSTSTSTSPTTPLSQRTLSSINDFNSTSTNPNPNPNNTNEPSNCICFITTLTEGSDRIVSSRKAGKLDCWNKGEREVVDAVKKAIVAEMGTKDTGDFLWDF